MHVDFGKRIHSCRFEATRLESLISLPSCSRGYEDYDKMSDSIHASSRDLVREKIPGSAVDGMVEFLEKYYLTPALHASTIDSYSKRGPGAGRNFELSWRTGGPTAAAVPRPEQFSISVRLTIGLDGVAIDFGGEIGRAHV